MALLPIDPQGWCVWKPIDSGPDEQRCKFVYVDEQDGLPESITVADGV